MRSILLLIVAILAITLLLYFPVVSPGVIAFSTDNNIGAEALLRNVLKYGYGGMWMDSGLLGGAGTYWPNWTGFLLNTLPLVSYVNWVHAIDLTLGSFFLAIFLRRKGVSSVASYLLALLAACWLGVNFCLVYAGHNNKFATVMLAALALVGIHESVKRRSVLWAVVTGGILGGALLEQQDVAFLYCVFWGAYAVFCCVRQSGVKPGPMLRILLPMAGMIVLIAGSPAAEVYRFQAIEAQPGGGQTPQAKWEFITQWSQPPDETIELLAPGYMGWRSGEPDGPYWGRCGRSAEWETTRQGFMNFRLDALYIGAIPIVLALFSAIAALMARRKAKQDEWLGAEWGEHRAEILFWSGVAVMALLLSYGKFTPVYWLFYQLPVVNNIRGPAKFLQIFQIALAILAAYGLDLALALARKRKDQLLGC